MTSCLTTEPGPQRESHPPELKSGILNWRHGSGTGVHWWMRDWRVCWSIVTESASDRRVPVDWVREELSFILRILDDTEKSETEVWLLTARLSGLQARASRAEEWSAWYRQTTTRIAEVRRSLATVPSPPAEAPSPFSDDLPA